MVWSADESEDGEPKRDFMSTGDGVVGIFRVGEGLRAELGLAGGEDSRLCLIGCPDVREGFGARAFVEDTGENRADAVDAADAGGVVDVMRPLSLESSRPSERVRIQRLATLGDLDVPRLGEERV